jgi:hypothetical protein
MTAKPLGVPESVRLGTEGVRRGDRPVELRLRQLFVERGLDIHTSLFDYWSEDTSLLEGFVVTSSGRVYKWDFDFLDRDQLESSPDKGDLTKWREVTDEPSAWYPRRLVESVRSFVLSGGRLE